VTDEDTIKKVRKNKQKFGLFLQLSIY